LKKTADSRIRRQANNNDENQFVDSIFPQIFNEAAQDCYTNQTDAYRKLFKNQDFYNQIMQQMGRAMYEHYRAQQEQAYTIANLRTKMLAKIKPEFSVITNSARTVEEAFDWTMKIIHDKSNEKYAGLEDIVLSSLYKLYCSTQPLSLSDKRTFLRNIVTSYESYLKKLYLMIEHKEVTDKNGSAEYAALSNAIYCLKALNQLKYNHDEESDKFSDYLDILVSLRNAENHSGIAIQENEVDLGIHIVSTMYLYVTYRYITELEMN
jgi:type I restriction enzyme R subunit